MKTNIRFLPMVCMPALFVFFLFGNRFLLFLPAGMYRLGAAFGNPWIGAAAAAMTLSVPAVFHASRTCLMEFPDTALFVLFATLVVDSDFSRERSFSLAAGCVAGKGMLTKQTFIFYAVFPALAAIVSLDSFGSHGDTRYDRGDYLVVYGDGFDDPRYRLLSAYPNGLRESAGGLYLFKKRVHEPGSRPRVREATG